MKRLYGMITLCTLSTGLAAADYNFKPGLWETTNKVEFVGVPEQFAAMMSQAPTVHKNCITSEDTDFKFGDESQQHCTQNNQRVNAAKMTFEVSCQGQGGNVNGKGEFNYHDTSANGWTEMVIPQGPAGGPMTIRTIFNSKYLGACP